MMRPLLPTQKTIPLLQELQPQPMLRQVAQQLPTPLQQLHRRTTTRSLSEICRFSAVRTISERPSCDSETFSRRKLFAARKLRRTFRTVSLSFRTVRQPQEQLIHLTARFSAVDLYGEKHRNPLVLHLQESCCIYISDSFCCVLCIHR